MPRTKQRSLALLVLIALLVGGFAVATGLIELLPVVIGLLGASAVLAFSRIDDGPAPANNALKQPLNVLCALLGLGFIGWGIEHDWRVVVVGVFFLAIAAPAIWVVYTGRNPWWTRAPADYWRRRS